MMVHANYPLEKTVHHSGENHSKRSHELKNLSDNIGSYENPKITSLATLEHETISR